MALWCGVVCSEHTGVVEVALEHALPCAVYFWCVPWNFILPEEASDQGRLVRVSVQMTTHREYLTELSHDQESSWPHELQTRSQAGTDLQSTCATSDISLVA